MINSAPTKVHCLIHMSFRCQFVRLIPLAAVKCAFYKFFCSLDLLQGFGGNLLYMFLMRDTWFIRHPVIHVKVRVFWLHVFVYNANYCAPPRLRRLIPVAWLMFMLETIPLDGLNRNSALSKISPITG